MHENGWLGVLLPRGWLEHHFSFLDTDSEPILMLSPKLSHAWENWSILCCISDSVTALRAQSSANKSSRMVVDLVLVLAFKRLRLKSFPSVRYLMLTPGSSSVNALVNMAENIMLNRVGANTQPCLTTLHTGKSGGYLTIVLYPSHHAIIKLTDDSRNSS